jgi:hypothetical protein
MKRLEVGKEEVMEDGGGQEQCGVVLCGQREYFEIDHYYREWKRFIS